MGRRLLAFAAAAALLGGVAGAQTRIAGDGFADDPTGVVAEPCPMHPAPTDEASKTIAHLHQLTRDFAQLCRYRAENRQLLATGQRPHIVFLGDSITAHWIEQDRGFFQGGIVDRGISGQTSAQMLLRFRQDVIDLRPDAVHILAGTNDIAGNTGATTIEAIVANIASMAELARAHGIRVILGAVPPATRFYWSPEKRPAATVAALDAMLAAYAAAAGFAYVDYHAAMAAADGTMRPDLSSDGVHPNAAGYAVMRSLVERAMR